MSMQRIMKTSTASLFSVGFVSGAFADINWQPCDGEMPDSQYQCANVYVPLNHQQPSDASAVDESGEGVVSIALARLPASDSANKKGTLFLNPGGPGVSGVDFLLNAGQYLYTKEVRQYYDLVGFDPRGIGRSDALTCFEDTSEINHYTNRPMFPTTPEEIHRNEELDQYFTGLCQMRAGDLINHMSTADVARDMDLLRQAVGDEKLNFAGYSYGSYLGVTYANLFPENVGAMIVQGVVDPIAWSTGRGWRSHFFPYLTRIRSAEGAHDTLHEFFRLCDEAGMEGCALAGNAESRYDSVVARVREEPITVKTADGLDLIVDYSIIIAYTNGVLYKPSSWPEFASFLASVEESLPSDETADRFHSLRRSLGLDNKQPDGPVQQPPSVGRLGVSCADSDNPFYYEYWTWAAEVSDSLYPYFGSHWTWASSACHTWPGAKDSRYAGKFKVKTENPILVVNNLFDPATPYHGAKKVKKLLRNSRLLTINGWGHTGLFTSECANNIVSDYLVSGSLPDKGVSCDPDFTPFKENLSGDARLLSAMQDSNQNNREKKEELQRKMIKDIYPYNIR
jgi:pimeloyl-ACP methyl ester carboxylesterase